MMIVTGDAMRNIDKKAVNEFGIKSIDLMENAGKGTAELLLKQYGERKLKNTAIICGKGNNGGDGFVIARILAAKGIKPKVYVAARKQDVEGNARVNMLRLEKEKIKVSEIATFKQFDDAAGNIGSSVVLIDALLGTGFKGSVSGIYAKIIKYINSLKGKTIISIDVPSGLNSDNGKVINECIRADHTITLGLVKTGLLMYPGIEFAGKVNVVDIGLPESLVNLDDHLIFYIDQEVIKNMCPKRKPDCHKGSVGRVLVAGGSLGYVGAPCLTALAGLRSGCGIVTLAVPESIYQTAQAKMTEVIVRPLPEKAPGVLAPEAEDVILELLRNNDVLAAGPGLGIAKETASILKNILLKVDKPLVLDADALNIISRNPSILKKVKPDIIITPHPGEFSRLTGYEVEYIQSSRIESAEEFADRYNTITVLKGARTVVAVPKKKVYVNSTGNSGMATAGAGDVLTGIIASFAAQGLTAENAAAAGVFVHGLAGDIAAEEKSECGLIASDIIENIPYAIKKIKAGDES
jgi:NAD(P)H-hydrate epimerase